MRIKTKFSGNQEGVALIMVLWVLVLMAAVATEFSYSMRTEIICTTNFKEEMESRFLAESGIELAMGEILEAADFHSLNEEGQLVFGFYKTDEDEDDLDFDGKGKKTSGKQNKSQKGKTTDPADNESKGTIEIVPTRLDIPLGAGTVSYRIIDENRKININSAQKETLMKVLEAGGVDDEDLVESISDSILDWIDKDDLHRLNGVEDDHYQSLPEPYACKNAKFDSLEELLLVDGMTPEILFGTDLVSREDIEDLEYKDEESVFPGIYSMLTVQNVSSLNQNTAGEDVLSVFNSPEDVEAILEKRGEEGKWAISKSTHFTIYSLGEIKDSGIKHLIVATVEANILNNKGKVMVTYWNDNENPQKYYDLFN